MKKTTMDKQDEILRGIDELKYCLSNLSSQSKTFLDINEAARYLKITKSSLYKKTANKDLIYYQPSGKKILFEKKDLDDFIIKGRQTSREELEKEALKIVRTL